MNPFGPVGILLRLCLPFVVAVVAGSSSSALGHGDLHKRILEVSKQITERPKVAALRLERAELHRAHNDWKEADADLVTAAKLDPKLDAVHVARSRLRLEQGRPREALACAETFLVRKPEHAVGWVAKARALEKLGRVRDAAVAWGGVIDHAKPPRPEHYLNRSRLLERTGPVGMTQALKCLEKGLLRLRGAVALDLEAMRVERALRRFDAALKRVDRLAGRSKRQERWSVTRGEILEEARRKDAAAVAFRRAITAIEARRRRSKAVEELLARARAGLKRLGR